MRDAYEFYGYDFEWYDGAPVNETKVKELIQGFTTLDGIMRETWRKVFKTVQGFDSREPIDLELEETNQEELLDNFMLQVRKNRIENAKVLLGGLRFVNKNGQPLYMMPKLKLDPDLLEQPLYH